MTPQVHGSETHFTGRAFGVRVDDVEYAPGRRHRIETVVHSAAVTMLPVEDGQIWFVRQYRHSAEATLLELPAGTLNAGEDPVIAAGRELQEEIGQRAATLTSLGSFWLAPGYSTELMHAFLATGFTPDALEQDEDEVIEVVRVPVAEALELARSGAIRDSKTLATLFLALPLLAVGRGA